MKDEDVLKVQVKGSREGGGVWLISGGRGMLRLAAGSKENSEHEVSSSQNVSKCVEYCYGPTGKNQFNPPQERYGRI